MAPRLDSPLKHRGNIAVAVNEESNWQAKNAPVESPKLLVAHNHGIVNIALSGQADNGRGVIVHGNGDDLEALRTKFLLPADKMRHFDLAWRAPCGPESEQYHAPLKGCKINPLAVDVVPHKLGGELVQQRGRRRRGDGRAAGQQKRRDKHPCARGIGSGSVHRNNH